MCCANCDKTLGGDSFKTAYGDWLCEDCWDEYILTEAGLLEYLIGICYGDYPMSDFDADFLGRVIMSWIHNSNNLDLTVEQREEIFLKARELKLL
jgi:hypothetical protein